MTITFISLSLIQHSMKWQTSQYHRAVAGGCEARLISRSNSVEKTMSHMIRGFNVIENWLRTHPLPRGGTDWFATVLSDLSSEDKLKHIEHFGGDSLFT